MYGRYYVHQAYPFYRPYVTLQAENQFPPVNTEQLQTSAKQFEAIIQEVNRLIQKILTSPTFAKTLMDTAQQSDHEKVNELILSTGVTAKVETTFSPSGIQIAFDNTEQGKGCCQLTVHLVW